MWVTKVLGAGAGGGGTERELTRSLLSSSMWGVLTMYRCYYLKDPKKGGGGSRGERERKRKAHKLWQS